MSSSGDYLDNQSNILSPFDTAVPCENQKNKESYLPQREWNVNNCPTCCYRDKAEQQSTVLLY